MKTKNAVLVLALLAVSLTCSSCAITFSGILAGAAQVASPIARTVSGDRGETLHTAGARVGEYGAGVFVGRVPDGLTPTERERLDSVEAWIANLEAERALATAPDK